MFLAKWNLAYIFVVFALHEEEFTRRGFFDHLKEGEVRFVNLRDFSRVPSSI